MDYKHDIRTIGMMAFGVLTILSLYEAANLTKKIRKETKKLKQLEFKPSTSNQNESKNLNHQL